MTATGSHTGGGVPRQRPRRYRPALVPGLSAAILLFVAVFWLFLAMGLQQVDFNQTPAWWLAQVDAFPLLAFVPAPFVTFLSELFSWRVFRHVFIPTVIGWWLAGEAAAGFVRSFYNFSSRAEAANFLSRLQSHGGAAVGTAPAVSAPTVAPATSAAPRRGGRTRLGPALKLAMVMAPMGLTFLVLLLISPLLPPSPTRTIVYNALIIISGAVTAIAIVYLAIDAFAGGAPVASGLRLQRESLETMRRQHALLRVGGPGRIVVPNHEVAVTEYNARFYRVLGPGVQTLRPFEYVRSMLDLRPQDREGEVAGITQDGVEVTCHIAVTFRLSNDDRYLTGDGSEGQAAPEQAQRPTRDRPYPYGERAACTASYIETIDGEGRVLEWTALPLVVATGQFRRALTTFPLDILYDPDGQGSAPHPELWKTVHNSTRDVLRNSGIELVALRMGPLEPPQSVLEENLNGWRSYWEKDLHRRKIEGRVEAAATVEDARTRAALEMMRTIMNSIEHARRESNTEITQEIMALRLLEALERVASSAEETDLQEESQVQRQLGALRRGLLPPGANG